MASRDKIVMRTEEGGDSVYTRSAYRYRKILIFTWYLTTCQELFYTCS